ncbi:hypothetical protein [Geotalea sp. SG265]|uniref:hypothetical protein n=1 Tax=Geotalea sp. SG265 TaxID=2922867 RepID=UPI001FAF246B|nr:hypothetical protein [Geotalea sp. SG265]
MFCPQCKTEYVEGIRQCADCRIPLVHRLPVSPLKAAATIDPHASMVAILETGDSYEFLTAAEALRETGIPFTGQEEFTGEFRAHKVAQAPYLWTLLVPEDREDEARHVLDGERVCGPAAMHLMMPDNHPPTYSTRGKLLLLAVLLVFFCGMMLLLKR